MAEKSVGGIWKKQGKNGLWLSISVEIDGVKHSFCAFRNDYKEEGDNKPDYKIMPSKPREQKPVDDLEPPPF